LKVFSPAGIEHPPARRAVVSFRRVRLSPPGLLLDGELVAWRDGDPYFPDVCARVLNRDASIPITFVAFDVLRIDGENTMDASFEERRAAARPYDGRTERREGRR
jgi:ATP-dependent DNA ligase